MDPTPSNPTGTQPEKPVTPETPTTDTPVTTSPVVEPPTNEEPVSVTPGVVPDAEAPEVIESHEASTTPEVQETPAVQEIPAVPVTPEVAPVSDATPTPQAAATDSTPPFAPLGEPVGPNGTAPVSSVDPGHGLGIASLVLSILGVHLVGLILGIIALNKSKKAGHTNNLALAAIILSGIGLSIAIIFAVLFIPTLIVLI